MMELPGGLRLDDRDLRMLAILQREGRISKTALAARVNLSPTPAWERMQRLERAGVITGYGARLDAAVFGRPTVIFVQVELARHRAADFERFERAVVARPEIVDARAVGGGTDYILRTETESVDAYQRLIDRLLAAEIGLSRYYSFVVTKPVKRSPGPLLPLEGEDAG